MTRVAGQLTVPPAVRGLRLPRRSPEALSLAGFLLSAGACLVLAVLAPMSDHAPLALGRAMAVVAFLLAALTFLLGDRLGRRGLPGVVVLAAVLNSVLVAASHTSGGAMLESLAYGWLAVYVAFFFPRAAAPFSLLAALLFGGGLLLAGIPRMLTPWAIASLTTGLAATVVARLSTTMRWHAVTDQLTGTLNRGGLAAAAERAGARRRRGDRQVAVAVLDLDGFKEVNDGQGHAAGDRLLAELTGAWRAVLRADDVLGRIGGDEFVIVMPRTTPAAAEAVLSRLRAAHPFAWSAGVAAWEPGEPLEAGVERADRALYAAKAARADGGRYALAVGGVIGPTTGGLRRTG